MTAVVQIGRCESEIIFESDKSKFGDKVEDLKSKNEAEGKSKDNIKKVLAVKAKLQIKIMKKYAKIE